MMEPRRQRCLSSRAAGVGNQCACPLCTNLAQNMHRSAAGGRAKKIPKARCGTRTTGWRGQKVREMERSRDGFHQENADALRRGSGSASPKSAARMWRRLNRRGTRMNTHRMMDRAAGPGEHAGVAPTRCGVSVETFDSDGRPTNQKIDEYGLTEPEAFPTDPVTTAGR